MHDNSDVISEFKGARGGSDGAFEVLLDLLAVHPLLPGGASFTDLRLAVENRSRGRKQ